MRHIYRSFSVLTKAQQFQIKLNNINKLIFNYDLNIPSLSHPPTLNQFKNFGVDYPKSYERFMEKQLLSIIRNYNEDCKLPSDLKTLNDFKEFSTKNRSTPLVNTFRHSNYCSNHSQFNEFIENLFYYKTILMNDTSVKYLIKNMKYTNFEINIHQLNYIVKNLIKAGRLNEVDEVLEELASQSLLNNAAAYTMVKRRILLKDDFLEKLFVKDGVNTSAKIQLLDNLIKLYYELNDYRYLKELIRYRERFYTDKIIDNELMFIKLSWRLKSNYNCKIISAMCNDFVKFENTKYQKMNKTIFYKLLESILANGELELIASFLKTFQNQFNTTKDPLTTLMVSRFKMQYLEPQITSKLYCQNLIKFKLYFEGYDFNNKYGNFGKLLNHVNKQLDLSIILKNNQFIMLLNKEYDSSAVSYFLESLLKINSKKILNQSEIFRVLKKSNKKFSNLDNTEKLDIKYYRLLLAKELKDINYLKNEFLKKSCLSLINNLDIFLDAFNDVNLKISEQLLMVLLNNSTASVQSFEDEISSKIISFNKVLAFHKLNQEKINKLMLSNTKLTEQDLMNIQRLHYKDKIYTTRFVIKNWKEYKKILKYRKTSNIPAVVIPPVTKLLDLENLFKNPFIYNNLSKVELTQSISLNYYLRFLLFDYDAIEYNEFLVIKNNFKHILPVELAHRSFHYALAVKQVEDINNINREAKETIFKNYDNPTQTQFMVLKKRRLKRKYYRESFNQEINEFCVFNFLETLSDFETTMKTTYPKRDMLLGSDYFKIQLQEFVENSLELMLNQHYYIAASQVMKRYLSSYNYNFMSEIPKPIFEVPNQKIETVFKKKHEHILSFFNIKEDGTVFYDIILKKLQSLSNHPEFQKDGGKVNLKNTLLDDLPYKNKNYSHKDMMATRMFFDKMRKTFPRFKLYWILRTYDEIKRFSYTITVKMNNKTETATKDLADINNKLKDILKP